MNLRWQTLTKSEYIRTKIFFDNQEAGIKFKKIKISEIDTVIDEINELQEIISNDY